MIMTLSSRASPHVVEGLPASSCSSRFATTNGYDSYHLLGGRERAEKTKKATAKGGQTQTQKQRIEGLDRILSDRDKAMLRSIEKCRYLTTAQIRRLHITESVTQSAATRATNRVLNKLQGYGLIVSLARRIGGVRAGSASYVWTLSEEGAKLLQMNRKGKKTRKRFFEPSPAFLEHTLAVAETYVQLAEICRRSGIELVKAELEPYCWRRHIGENGNPAYLKPDLFAKTLSATPTGEYEDSLFIEVDLDTESPAVVLEKCRKYCFYYKSGIEQERTGMFPLVVWIVPSLARKESLHRNIAKNRDADPSNIFLFITPDDFETLIIGGADALTEKKGEIAS